MEDRSSQVPGEPQEDGARRGVADPLDPLDPLVGELHRERRDRRVLVVAAAIGIIAGAVVGMIFMLGEFGHADAESRGFFRRHGALFFVIGPPILSMATGYAIFFWRRRRHRAD